MTVVWAASAMPGEHWRHTPLATSSSLGTGPPAIPAWSHQERQGPRLRGGMSLGFNPNTPTPPPRSQRRALRSWQPGGELSDLQWQLRELGSRDTEGTDMGWPSGNFQKHSNDSMNCFILCHSSSTNASRAPSMGQACWMLGVGDTTVREKDQSHVLPELPF